MDLFITCKPGFETILAHELVLYDLVVHARGNGWVRAQPAKKTSAKELPFQNDACFSLTTLKDPLEIRATSANDFIEKLLDAFITHLGATRLNAPWPLEFAASLDERLAQRAKTVEDGWLLKLRKKMSRVAKLASPGIPPGPVFLPGFFVYFIDFNRALAAFNAHYAGQARMRFDDLAPSRSYLKIEEAYQMIGAEPKKGETVVDLGAAPGGWSYSALKRNARVTAVDNGALKEPVKSHPRIVHLREDALKFNPSPDIPVDWLFCDIIEDPEIIFDLVHTWLKKSWCQHFIVNFKLGHADPILLLQKIRDPRHGLAPFCRSLKIRHLYHNREEITVAGEHL